MNDRVKASRLVRRLYKNLLSFDKFSMDYPSDSDDIVINQLFDLVEHEPKKGGLLGVNTNDYASHINMVFDKVYELEPVPSLIDGAKTLFYTDIDGRHLRTGQTRHYVAGQLVEQISGLVICKYDNDPGYYLLGCDENWDSVTDTYHDSVDDAKGQAEFEYKNSRATWRKRE